MANFSARLSFNSIFRKMLEENDIKGKFILQCEGDAVFIPSGAIHQVNWRFPFFILRYKKVLNINSCIKIACDFISPQCVRRSLLTTEELRQLSSTHQNREDKLQLKAHLFHTAKEIFRKRSRKRYSFFFKLQDHFSWQKKVQFYGNPFSLRNFTKNRTNFDLEEDIYNYCSSTVFICEQYLFKHCLSLIKLQKPQHFQTLISIFSISS